MKVNEILRNTDRLINFYENENLYKNLSNISNFDDFCKYVSKFDNDNNFINGIIEIYNNAEKKSWCRLFIDKYNLYLTKKLEDDCRDYYNNNYVLFLFIDKCLNTSDNEYEGAIFFNGKKMVDIDNILIDKYNYLISRMNNKEKLDTNDKKFIEQTFLCHAFYSSIYKMYDGNKDMMYDIVSYFNKYPINDLSDLKNKQLMLLSIISNNLIKINSNCGFQFSNEIIDDSLGEFYLEDDIPIIKINALDIYDIQSNLQFVKKIYTIYHEIGHFMQKINESSYDLSIQQIFKMESELVKSSMDFYHKYHDNFFVERDADYYAMRKLRNNFYKLYPDEVNKVLVAKGNLKRIDVSKFLEMEYHQYDLIKNKSKGR